jgi:hypothetical protein
VRARLCLLFPAGLLLTGCGPEAAGDGPVTLDPAPVVVDVPAASSGGACRWLDFTVIEQTTGSHFDVAAASRRGGTQTCVVRAEDAPRPDLVLSVTVTSVDAAGFATDAVPKGGRRMTGLGKAAYQVSVAAGTDRGPAVEVGWLAGDGRVLSLRYTFAAGADPAGASDLGAKLVALARRVDADRR